MILKSIQLILQRKATRDELREYEYYRELFDAMSPLDRESNQVRRVADLIKDPNSVALHVVYYGTRKEAPLFNEIYIEPVALVLGRPGAREAAAKKISSMMVRYRTRKHRYFYATGEVETETGKPAGFRTLTPRAEVPLRSV